MSSRLTNIAYLLILIAVVFIVFLAISGSSSGHIRGQVDSVRIEPRGEIIEAHIKIRGTPGSTFVATYGSQTQLERDRNILAPGQWVIIDYHGPTIGGDQEVERIKLWKNR